LFIVPPELQTDAWLPRPPRPTVPPRLRPWLTDPASLTARIRARCERFSVRVLGQRLARVHSDEAAVLGLAAGELAWLREVVLEADGVGVVYARSIMPRGNLRGDWTRFTGLGNRPLGAALFADPRIARQPLHVARLDRRDGRYHLALEAVPAGAHHLWARRSVFLLGGRPLLVCEVFLPGIVELRP
jgi:chorismate--pyruvate lyase